MPLLDTGYSHYDDTYRGVWYRRWVIAQSGISRLLANKWVRFFVGLTWMLCLVQVALLFFIGQLLVPDSLVFDLLGIMGREQQGFFNSIRTWLGDHPEISVHTVYNFLFYQYALYSSIFGFVILAMAVPQLITVDFSSRALLIYSSKALNRFDYLLGKFGIAFGMLSCVWLGPVLTAWVMGNLLSPDWSFFLHSSRVLANLLIYIVSSMVILSIVALAISALATKERNTVALWICLWFSSLMFNGLGILNGKVWLQHLSITHNLKQIAVYVFQLKEDMMAATEFVPVVGEIIRELDRIKGPRPPIIGDMILEPNWQGAYIGLVAVIGVSMLIIARKVRPEDT